MQVAVHGDRIDRWPLRRSVLCAGRRGQREDDSAIPGLHLPGDYRGSDRIEEYEAVQVSPGRVRIALRIEPESRAEAEEAVRAMLDDLYRRTGCQPMEIEFASYAHTAGDRKLRRVRRCWT